MADELDERTRGWRESLSDEQRDVINAYSRGLYQSLNRVLRDDPVDLDYDVSFLRNVPGVGTETVLMPARRARDLLSSAIESPPPPPPVVYRPIGTGTPWDREGLRVGHVVQFDGFNSSSISTHGYELQGGTVMEIVPRQEAWLGRIMDVTAPSWSSLCGTAQR